MRGRGFITLHPAMDKLMDEINAQLDEVSERLIIIGGAPYSTLREFADNTKIQDIPASYERSIDEWVRHLLVGYEYLIGLYQEGIETAGEEGDDVSQDICIGFKGDIEKVIWMLRAHLKRSEPWNLNQIQTKKDESLILFLFGVIQSFERNSSKV